MSDGARAAVTAGGADPWDGVVGQPRAVRRLRTAAAAPVHAYLLVGPPGCAKDVAARAFAATVLAADGADAGRTARLALAREHPDVHEFERVGPAITAEQARRVVAEAALAPVEGTRKVLVLHEFHLVRPEAAAVLLKSIEEPPASTHFVVCADLVPAELVTIASRCVRIAFGPIAADVIAELLLVEGADPDAARLAADTADGDLDRARLLAADPGLAARRDAFAGAARRLDGSGSAAFDVAAELLALIEDAAAPLVARHAGEVAEMDRRIEQVGERGSGKRALEERHKRELRRHRSDELRAGLWVMARTYRDDVVAAHAARDNAASADAVTRIAAAIESLERNPNESLLLQSLLWSMSPLPR